MSTTEKNEEKHDLESMRHTAAHVLAAASTKLRPETKLGVGPAIEDGFYHDIDVDPRYSESDLKILQKEMEKIQKMDLPITHREVSKDEARKMFAHDPYKLELIEEIEEGMVGISDMGDGFFVTLCRGGHVSSTKHIGHFKLTSLAGVYWKANEANAQLQRIYGILFPTKEELKQHQDMLMEAKKRDHRKIGQELDLFTFSPLVGPGLPLFTPRGTVIRRELEQFLHSLQHPLGYERVTIPHLAKSDLYKTSGHWDKFKNDLFHVRGKSEDQFVIKPMNCPHHTQIFASKPRSYKDLPLRYCENTAVYRDEQAGELQGLTRVRSITQDDAHVFCRPDQIQQEVEKVLQIITSFYKPFSLEISPRLSTRDASQPQNYLGSDEIWNQAEDMLREALITAEYTDVPEAVGDAAFYGPKIDFIAKDAIGRTWQLATAQLDFNQPKRFELSYIDSNGEKQTPVMIHRAILGSFERFMAVLLEHYAGNLPLWLSPTQIIVVPISEQQKKYARGITNTLLAKGVRIEQDDRSESMGKKIREAEKMKTPYMLIIGQQEVENKTVTVRRHGSKDQTTISAEEFNTNILKQINERN